MRIWLLALLVPLAGCTDDPSFSISGSLTAERTDTELQELQSLGQEHGGDVQIRESSPEQFTIADLSEQDCEDLRAELLNKTYLEGVGPCVEERAGADPY